MGIYEKARQARERNEEIERSVHPGMTRDALLEALRTIVKGQECFSDIEADHALADDALLAYINDDEISRLYGEISKWYA